MNTEQKFDISIPQREELEKLLMICDCLNRRYSLNGGEHSLRLAKVIEDSAERVRELFSL